MNRREALKVIGGLLGMAVAPPLLANPDYSPHVSIGQRWDTNDFLQFERIHKLAQTGYATKWLIVFSCYEGLIKKHIVLTNCATITLNDKEKIREKSYQIAKRTQEAIRDMLYMRYPKTWRKYAYSEFIRENLKFIADQMQMETEIKKGAERDDQL